MDVFSSSDHPISDLVEAFLEAAQAVVGSTDPAISDARPAELSYELDQVVSAYLDDHQLPADLFEAIQQDVLNRIADQVAQDDADSGTDLAVDESGNTALSDVLAYLDQHFDSDPPALDLDPDQLAWTDAGEPSPFGLG